MKRIWLLVPLLAASCGDVRSFSCFHCGQFTQASGPGEASCRSCFRSNVWSACPSCGAQEPQPALGAFRCSSCGATGHASRCRTCSTVGFARDAGSPCPTCAAVPAGAPPTEAVRALRKSAEAHAARKDWDPAVADYEAALRLDPKDVAGRYAFACVLARAGRTDRALAELEAAVRFGFSNWDLLRKDGDLEPLRDHPRYRALLERAPR